MHGDQVSSLPQNQSCGVVVAVCSVAASCWPRRLGLLPGTCSLDCNRKDSHGKGSRLARDALALKNSSAWRLSGVSEEIQGYLTKPAGLSGIGPRFVKAPDHRGIYLDQIVEDQNCIALTRTSSSDEFFAQFQ